MLLCKNIILFIIYFDIHFYILHFHIFHMEWISNKGITQHDYIINNIVCNIMMMMNHEYLYSTQYSTLFERRIFHSLKDPFCIEQEINCSGDGFSNGDIIYPKDLFREDMLTWSKYLKINLIQPKQKYFLLTLVYTTYMLNFSVKLYIYRITLLHKNVSLNVIILS